LILNLDKVKDIATGGQHTIILTENGSVYSCGWGDYNQLGLDDNNDRRVPTEIEAMRGKVIKSITCGYYDTFFLLEDRNVYTCGLLTGRLCKMKSKIQCITTHPLQQNIKSVYAGHGTAYFQLYDSEKIYHVSRKQSLHELNEIYECLMRREYVDRISCGFYHTVFITNFGRVLLFRSDDEVFSQIPSFTNYIPQAACGENFTLFFPYVVISYSLQQYFVSVKRSQLLGHFSDVRVISQH
jgi:alpha-tubulin suppressor-like RCC1 family protein